MIMESLRERLVTTAVIYYIFLQLAIRFGIFGPTILDLMAQLKVTQQEMSFVFSAASLGVCVGAISSGYLFKYIPKQVGLANLLLSLGIIVSFVTSITNYYVFLTMQFLVGVTSGAAISACEAWVLEIWGESCPPYMQALQFFRGLGYILGPIIAEPFLAPEVDNSVTTTPTSLTGNAYSLKRLPNETKSATDAPTAVSQIYIPYILNGLMLILAAVMISIQYIYSIRKNRSKNMITTSSKETIIATIEEQPSEPNINEKEKEPKRETPKFYTYIIVTLCSLFYLFFFEEVIVTYLASFATNIDLHLTKSAGAFLTSIFNLANVVGKAVSIVVALKLKHFTMLYMHTVLIMISLIILIIFSNTSLIMLWVGICLLGVGLSSVVASLYALMESALTMDSMVCGILNMSGTLGSFFVPLAIASSIENFPIVLIYASLLCAVSCFIILIVINVLVVLRKRSVNKKIAIITTDCEKPKLKY